MEAEKDTEALKASEKLGSTSQETQEEEFKSPGDLQAAYQKLLAEKQELYDRLLRKQADFENFRKRAQREKEEFLQHANYDLVRSLLPVLDGFDRALKQRDPAAPAQFYEGLDLIRHQLLETLGRAGLAVVEAQGRMFDPEVHQAVETVESPQHREHEIVEELQRGYKLKHRLLRPAIVKVAVPAAQPQGNKRGIHQE